MLLDLALAAEAAGWDGFFLWDHLQYADPVPVADAWVSLAAIAARSATIRLGPLVTPLPRRRPWKVAREAVTLDRLSNGRLVLGVGLGIDFWREFGAFPGEAATDAERAVLLDEGIDVLLALWSGEPVTYGGRRHRVDAAQFVPGPQQSPRIPVWAAAVWPAARPGPIRRAARLDGIMPFSGAPFTPDEAAAVRDAVAAERGDDDFDVCVWGDGADADRLAAAGVTWLVQSFLPEEPLDEVRRFVAAGPPA